MRGSAPAWSQGMKEVKERADCRKEVQEWADCRKEVQEQAHKQEVEQVSGRWEQGERRSHRS